MAARDPASATTLRAIINFAREVGIGIIAEGVETQEQRSSLMATGSPMNAQGHYFSQAVSSQQAAELLKAGSIVHANHGTGAIPDDTRRATEDKE